jgi:hypothetical protein
MTYTKEDAHAAISRAGVAKGEHSTMLAEAQLEALATISELGDLNKALGKYGAVGELARQLDGLAGLLKRRS